MVDIENVQDGGGPQGARYVRICVAREKKATGAAVVVTFIGLVLALLGLVLLARVATGVRRRRNEPSTGAHGTGMALGGGLVFWGALLVVIDTWNS